MNHCPNEVLLSIFELACDDDGSTGRALSLVSRRIHHLAKDCMYRSIAIVGRRQIEAFATILESIPEGKRRVRHLFLASTSQNSTEEIGRLADDVQTSYVDFCDLTTRLLRVVAHSLVSCRIISHLARSATLIPISCPELRSLTLEGPFPAFPFVSHATHLPSLRTVIFSSFTDYPSCLFHDIATQAPHLTTIRFSPTQACRNLANDIAAALAIPAGPNSQPEFWFSLFEPVIPPSVKEVSVQPGTIFNPAARNAYCLRSVQELMMKKLLYMEKHDKSHRVKCVAPTPAPLPSDALTSWLRDL